MTRWNERRYCELMLEPQRNGVYKTKEFHGHGVKIVNMGELFAHDFIADQEMKRIELSDKEQAKSLLRIGDLLHARRSLVLAGAGRCSLVTAVLEPTTFESSLIRVRLNQRIALPQFYFYYFRSPQGRARLAAIASQTAVSGVTGTDLAKIFVPAPPLTAQCRIASILSAYDDLIENNTRRIAILEEMARRIYEEWFVHFRFPGHEQVRMVESELGLVPEGWVWNRLGDVASVNARSIKRGHEPDQITYVDISSVATARIDKAEDMPYQSAPGRARRIVADGDVIWACVRPNRKSYSLILDPKPDLIVSTGFAVLTPRAIPWTFLYQAVTTEDFVSYLVNHAKGAAYPAVGADDFEAATLLIPSEAMLGRFNTIAEPMARLSNALHRQNTNLRTTRDLLLPKLISGELDVSEMPEPEAAAA